MGNMLDFFRKGPEQKDAPRKSNTVSVYSVGPVPGRNIRQPVVKPSSEELTRASAIYAAGAAIFAVLTVFMFIQGMWFTGIIMIVPTFCLGGFSWYYMKP